MSLTPDYYISSSGYPELNREKFKLSPKSHTKENKQNISKNLKSSIIVFNCDKKLLKKRQSAYVQNVISTTPKQIENPCKWANDKERKCYINQQIKNLTEIGNESSNSNQQLDNRLEYDQRNLNGILKSNQTELMVTPFVDF